MGHSRKQAALAYNVASSSDIALAGLNAALATGDEGGGEAESVLCALARPDDYP